MKKIIIVCFLMISLTGCFPQKNNVNSSEKESAVTSTQTSSNQETTPLKTIKSR